MSLVLNQLAFIKQCGKVRRSQRTSDIKPSEKARSCFQTSLPQCVRSNPCGIEQNKHHERVKRASEQENRASARARRARIDFKLLKYTPKIPEYFKALCATWRKEA